MTQTPFPVDLLKYIFGWIRRRENTFSLLFSKYTFNCISSDENDCFPLIYHRVLWSGYADTCITRHRQTLVDRHGHRHRQTFVSRQTTASNWGYPAVKLNPFDKSIPWKQHPSTSQLKKNKRLREWLPQSINRSIDRSINQFPKN